MSWKVHPTSILLVEPEYDAPEYPDGLALAFEQIRELQILQKDDAELMYEMRKRGKFLKMAREIARSRLATGKIVVADPELISPANIEDTYKIDFYAEYKIRVARSDTGYPEIRLFVSKNPLEPPKVEVTVEITEILSPSNGDVQYQYTNLEGKKMSQFLPNETVLLRSRYTDSVFKDRPAVSRPKEYYGSSDEDESSEEYEPYHDYILFASDPGSDTVVYFEEL